MKLLAIILKPNPLAMTVLRINQVYDSRSLLIFRLCLHEYNTPSHLQDSDFLLSACLNRPSGSENFCFRYSFVAKEFPDILQQQFRCIKAWEMTPFLM